MSDITFDTKINAFHEEYKAHSQGNPWDIVQSAKKVKKSDAYLSLKLYEQELKTQKLSIEKKLKDLQNVFIEQENKVKKAKIALAEASREDEEVEEKPQVKRVAVSRSSTNQRLEKPPRLEYVINNDIEFINTDVVLKRKNPKAWKLLSDCFGSKLKEELWQIPLYGRRSQSNYRVLKSDVCTRPHSSREVCDYFHTGIDPINEFMPTFMVNFITDPLTNYPLNDEQLIIRLAICALFGRYR